MWGRDQISVGKKIILENKEADLAEWHGDQQRQSVSQKEKNSEGTSCINCSSKREGPDL